MVLRLALELPEERAFVRTTRQLGRTFLEELGVVTEDVDEIELIIGELCTNVIRHAHSAEHCFQVLLEFSAEQVVVEVADKGAGFLPEGIAPPGTERADFPDMGHPRVGGYGLRIVELLTDRLEFHAKAGDGTRIRAEKRLHFRDGILTIGADKEVAVA